MSEQATIERAEALMGQGQVDAALALTAGLAAGPAPSHLALASHSAALKLVGRREEALPFDLQAIDRFADSPIAWHNYAATLDDLGRSQEAVEACEQAFRLGMDSPQTFAVYARALRAAGNHERAEYAYHQSLLRAPAVTEVAAEYANYIWMRRGDVAAADGVLDTAFHAGAHPTPLLLAKATLYEAAGNAERSMALLDAATRKMPGELLIALGAGEFALRLERIEDAERYVRLAEGIDPASRSVVQLAAIVDLAQGRADVALAKLRAVLADFPGDQSLWGWAAVAARAAGDPLYGELCDYDKVVGAYDLATPEGWPSLEAFLSDLAKALKEVHLYQQHPTNQSLRHGSQSMHLLSGSNAPPIKAFFEAIDAPIREHMAKLGTGDDPLRRRNTLDYRIQGAWSVRLRPGGFHRDHFHPEGWLSSAFYVETPDAALETADRQGWIRFGQPPFMTSPPLPPEHFVRPKPGRLVLFPSYMWHGTVPFTTDESRLTVAFDAVPK
ncbi:putative 2OG-Fe(II) oxygenase [Phenylobacterium sp.]|uniref:putative 2OG-Fe(II) oxygenase n=1 Tax=Phenylobacterium sp. TaxID=1871053 RepID=UPI0011FA708C|nr:putative 2OG-Fe(II) oxygenase [Phenylobacterium sp.]THD63529.1 MAG: tetratricopeptide repeat protein [Phenylobacterium sp.]